MKLIYIAADASIHRDSVLDTDRKLTNEAFDSDRMHGFFFRPNLITKDPM